MLISSMIYLGANPWIALNVKIKNEHDVVVVTNEVDKAREKYASTYLSSVQV